MVHVQSQCSIWYRHLSCVPWSPSILTKCSGPGVLQQQLAVPGQDPLEAWGEGEGKGMAAEDGGL